MTISSPTYQFLKALLKCVPDLKIDNNHLMIISPDEGAMSRAVYFSNILGVDMGMFYKRRDYSTIVNGKNPIVAHEFLGDSVEGKNVVIIDDMISSGESMLEVAKQLKPGGQEMSLSALPSASLRMACPNLMSTMRRATSPESSPPT